MSDQGSELNGICLAVASFRNDQAVLKLVRDVLDTDRGGLLSDILIVDSQGTGAVPAAIREAGWERVRYFDHGSNLGSAGNLARRLELAAERGHRWVYAVNHDGEVDVEVVRYLVEIGESLTGVGAVYPLRYKIGRKKYDLTGRQRLPLPFRGATKRPKQPILDTYWSSSNGSLYATEPVLSGLKPWADLWMGWEDLGYGWLLEKNAYRQVIATEVDSRDPYEYSSRGRGRTSITLTHKPSWYAYYFARNLILVTRRNSQPISHWLAVVGRLALEVALTTAFRPDKVTRYRFLTQGIVDGVRGRTGKWKVP